MKNLNLKVLLVISIIILLGNPYKQSAYAFDDQNAHPRITEKAVNRTEFINYLKNQLGFPKGLDKKFRTYNFIGWPTEKTILELLQQGSTDEDDPTCRAANHFHDPLKAWTDSYVTDSPAIIQAWCRDTAPVWPQYSNITWATGYNIVC